ncbi:MAG: hypothetical protein INR73_06660 [Williamsia sp.]|nr:hypothetical protein [Williamsia sp.]
MKPQLLFSVTVQHSYFSNGKCNALSVEPTPDCTRLLRKTGLLYKQTHEADGLVWPADIQDGPVWKDTDTAFDFYICANDPDFAAYTQQPQKWPDEIYFFSNKLPSGDMSDTLYRSSVPNPSVQDRTTGKRLVGLLAIYNRGLAGTRFLLPFDAAGCIWKYYLLMDKPAENPPAAYSISSSVASFQAVAGLPDGVAKSLMDLFPDARVSLYVSASEIQFQEKGVKNVQLMNNDAVLLPHLPNPGLGDNGIKIINMRTWQPRLDASNNLAFN